MIDVQNWVGEYIGIPYKKLGNDFLGCDCFGLAELIYKNQFNISLPAYTHIDPANFEGVSKIVGDKKQEWIKLDKPEPNCIVLINIAGYPVHMGMAVTDEIMIHSLKGHDSALESFTGGKWVKRVEGFYKWHSM